MAEAQPTHPCSVACDLCGGRVVEPLSRVDRDGRPLRTVICVHCGLVYTDPRPQPGEVRDYYEHNYRLDYKATYQPRPKHVRRAAEVAADRVRRLLPLLKPGNRILDFGAGGGEVVYVLRALGYEASGFEPNEGYARFASEALGAPVTHGFYQDVKIPPESLDFITSFHVFEHLESPRDALTHAWGWLRAGGRIWVEVPNIEATCQWPGSRFHRAHLYNFNPASLQGLGHRAGLTVEVTRVSSDGGNLTVCFRKEAGPSAVADDALAGNYDRVRKIVTGHTALRHAFSAHPYARPLRKLAQRWAERGMATSTLTPRVILDRVIADQLGGRYLE